MKKARSCSAGRLFSNAPNMRHYGPGGKQRNPSGKKHHCFQKQQEKQPPDTGPAGNMGASDEAPTHNPPVFSRIRTACADAASRQLSKHVRPVLSALRHTCSGTGQSQGSVHFYPIRQFAENLHGPNKCLKPIRPGEVKNAAKTLFYQTLVLLKLRHYAHSRMANNTPDLCCQNQPKGEIAWETIPLSTTDCTGYGIKIRSPRAIKPLQTFPMKCTLYGFICSTVP